MNDQPDPNQELLRRLSRQTTICMWMSGSSLTILALMLFFPRLAAGISQRSTEIQKWMEPWIGGVLGVTIALGVVILSAAYVVSRISPAAPPEVKGASARRS